MTMPAGRRSGTKSTALKDRLPWWGEGEAPETLWPGVSLTYPAIWSSRNDRWETHEGAYYFDPESAGMAVQFFPTFLKHHIGEFAGQAFVLREDQDKLLTRPIFGWKQAATGRRRFRKVFAFCPKGFGKSPWGAGTGIYLTRYDNEPAAEVYAVAADIQQARIVHGNAKIMVESDPDLEAGSEVLRDSIVWAAVHASYRVLSSDASTKHGFRPHGVIFDEMHAQKNRDLYEALSKSMVKRRQPLMIIITHAGTDDEGICFEEYDLAQRVLSGSANVESTLPVLFQIRKGEDWTAEATWKRVNPGHGTTVQHDAIAVECSEALAEPRKRNDFLRYHLNKWTSQATAWIPIEWWDACQTTLQPDAELATLPVAAGLDLAQKWDLASFVLVFKHVIDKAESVEVVTEENGAAKTKQIALNYAITLIPFFWIPENTMRQHEKEDGVPYSLWVEQGLVTATEGDIIDYTVIYNDITQKILPRFPKLKQGIIGYDSWGATDIATKLRDLAGLPIEEVAQQYSGLNEPSQVYEALIKGRRVYQNGHRPMRWCHENLAVKTDDLGRIKPVKPKNPSKRVDGGVAAIMGLKMLSGLVPTQEVSLFFLPAMRGKR